MDIVRRSRLSKKLLLVAVFLVFFMEPAFAEEAVEEPIDSGDTAWMIVATALVMLMIPGVGFFYGGLVRSKNALSTIAMVFATMALITIQWVVVGYSLAFGSDIGGFVGSLDYLGLNGVGTEASGSIPHVLFMMFQGMFAMITAGLIVGGLVERVKFSSWMVLALLWSTLVYDPIAHWVWGAGGWLGELGALDFAGGTVVHINAGISALAIVLVVGARKGFKNVSMEPHNIPMVVLGAVLLWFGWFGFNAGSELAADGIAANALATTHIATASAALTWMLLAWRDRKPSVLGMATGAVAGLVAITPATAFVTPLASIAVGVGAGLFCYYALLWRYRKDIDESLDVWAVHGVGGTWGAIATGIFASVGATGLITGNPMQVVTQVVGVAATYVYAFVVTFVLAKLVDKVMGLRVEEQEEDIGLDISQHAERAYS